LISDPAGGILNVPRDLSWILGNPTSKEKEGRRKGKDRGRKGKVKGGQGQKGKGQGEKE